jgi:hypothetical protein
MWRTVFQSSRCSYGKVYLRDITTSNCIIIIIIIIIIVVVVVVVIMTASVV